jgi:hypothetical protein
MLAGDTALEEAPDGSLVLHTRRADLKARTPNQSVYLETSPTTTSPSASARPAPARPTWPWPAPSTRWSAARCSASC